MMGSDLESQDQTIPEFNHQSIEVMRDPYPLYKRLRNECPVAHTNALGGFWVVAKHDDIKAVERDYHTYSNLGGVAIPDQPLRLYPIDLDPPLQTAYRVILSPHFTAPAVQKWRPSILKESHALIDRFIERGEADLASELIRPVLPAVVLPKLGVPIEDVADIVNWTFVMTRDRVSDPNAVQLAGASTMTYLANLVAKRRELPAQQDILGDLLAAKFENRHLDDVEVQNVLMLLLFGALDTQAGVALEALLYFSNHPEEKIRISENPSLWSLAVEEFIRYTTPVQGLKRTVTKDTELHGVRLHAGERVFLLFGSGSRDEAHFSQADECILDRSPNAHLAFGSGPHLCVGRNLARLQIELTLRAVLERLPDYRLKPGTELEYLVGEARGIKALPVTFTPGRRLSAKS